MIYGRGREAAPRLELSEPARGPLVCDICGRFVSVSKARFVHEFGDYGSILSTTVECPRHVREWDEVELR